MYKSILILTMLKLNDEGTSLILDVPFRLYAQNIIIEGKDITYRLYDLSNKDKEVLAKIDYHHDDEAKVLTLPNNLGQDWDEIQYDPRYLKHYNVTKKATKFTQWDEIPKPIKEDGDGSTQENKSWWELL